MKSLIEQDSSLIPNWN